MSVPTDTTKIEVANLAAKDVPAPTPTPADAPFQDLRDKLATFNEPEQHPLEPDEPEAAAQEPAPTPAAPVAAAVAPPTPPAPAPASPAPPPIQAHPQNLLDAARQLGIEERFLVPGAVGTDVLQNHVLGMIQQAAKPAAAPVRDPDEAEIDALETELGMDPRVTRLLKKQAQQLKQLSGLAGVDKKLAEFEQRDQRRQAVSIGQALDDCVERLGAKYEKVLGKGGIQELVAANDKDAVGVRNTIFREAGIDQHQDTPAVAARKFEQAAKRLYGKLLADEPAAAKPAPAAPAAAIPAAEPDEKPKVLMTREEWDAASLGKPSASKPKASKGEKAAREAIRDYFREAGIENGVNDELDGVPN